MSKTIQDILNIFGGLMPNWTLQAPDPVPDRPDIASDGFYLLETPQHERIVLYLDRTSRTGEAINRKPQIRFFSENPRKAYDYAQHLGLRFFMLLFCDTPVAELELDAAIRPDDYIVSIESKFDDTTAGRADIRSMYEQISEHTSDSDFFRVYHHQHRSTSLNQAAFIRISDSSDTIDPTILHNYLRMFDNRPYMSAADTNSTAVAQNQSMDFNALLYTATQPYDPLRPWNWLVFGAPGTGKSHFVNQALVDWEQDGPVEALRVTFYEDYTYTQFVGGYMPVPDSGATEYSLGKLGNQDLSWQLYGERVSYRFCPGPFTLLLAKAYAAKLKGEATKFVLVVEELNRANAPGVFGDMLQLLDRTDGVSDYTITPAPFMQEYFVSAVQAAGLPPEVFGKLRLPDNFYLWATMNSADQGVFPLDTAFKRRWSILYRDIDDMGAEQPAHRSIWIPLLEDEQMAAVEIDWNVFRQGINRIITSVGLDEDRCVGYWFFSDAEMEAIRVYTELSTAAFNGDDEARQKLGGLATPLVDKLFSYLRQDVFRSSPTKFFREEYRTFSTIRGGLGQLRTNGAPVDLLSVTRLEADSIRRVSGPAAQA